ncbi:MAG TPA: holo-[acyl-carrier-protein] synthase [Candidatus Coatesbacteria bacterium]|nr:holo-[acyl-carrier-protein] synthase [Candidatus Coatesbacteria bacterium]
MSDILGLGIDVVSLARFSRLFRVGREERLRRHVFSEREWPRRWGAELSPGLLAKLSARFAVKEAAMKALGCGWGQGSFFRDFEVLSDSGGGVRLELHGSARDLARERGINRWFISIAHERYYSIATALALRD